jgi:hypothetical protein
MQSMHRHKRARTIIAVNRLMDQIAGQPDEINLKNLMGHSEGGMEWRRN